MKILFSNQIKELEELANINGVSNKELMEIAGNNAYKTICKYSNTQTDIFTVLCGKGNNGGDGFVIARNLANKGANVEIVLVQDAVQASNAKLMFDQTKLLGIKSYCLSSDKNEILQRLKTTTIIVDAIFGIGYKSKNDSFFDEFFDQVNNTEATKFAVDIPSGLECDDGNIKGCFLKSDYTISFHSYKPCNVTYPSAEYCGKVIVEHVYICKYLIDEVKTDFEILEIDYIKSKFKPRKADANKGNYGRLLSVVSSMGMIGAGILSGKSALRCGVGLLDMAIPKSVYYILGSELYEPVFTLLEKNEYGAISSKNLSLLIGKSKKSTACLIGCGLGFNCDTEKLVQRLLTEIKIPTVLDADGINSIVSNINILRTTKADLILTPHPGEMARLLGTTADKIQENRYEIAKQFAVEYNVTLVLKGANTLIATSDGKVFLNPTGNAGMAKGGSGDILAGIIASFLAQGMTPWESAVCGVYLHGLAGDQASEKHSERAMLPTDIIEELPELFLNLK